MIELEFERLAGHVRFRGDVKYGGGSALSSLHVAMRNLRPLVPTDADHLTRAARYALLPSTMRSIALAASLLLASTIAACGGGGDLSPRQGCEEAAVALCERLYTCYTPAELATAGYPASEAGCVTKFQTDNGCAAQTEANTCTGNEKYNAGEANTCIDQIGGLACGQVRDPNLNIDTAAPACAKVCAVP